MNSGGVYKVITSQSGSPCPHPWFDVWINASGMVYCCPQNRTVNGNIISEEFSEIWNSSSSQSVRSLIANGYYEEAGCQRECLFLRGTYNPPAIHPPSDELINPDFDYVYDGSVYSQNLSFVIDAYQRKSPLVNAFPLFVDIQPTVICNSNCIMCKQPHDNNITLPMSVYAKLSLLKPYANYFRWQGGEVFILDWFMDYLMEFDDIDYPHLYRYVITNGSLFDKDKILLLLDKGRPVHFLVSMDGVRQETYGRIRRNLDIENVMFTIELLSDIQREKKLNNMVRWNYVVMKSTLEDMMHAVDIADELCVNLNFAPIQGDFKNENIFLYPDITKLNLQNYFNEIETYSATKNINISGLIGIKYRLRNIKLEK